MHHLQVVNDSASTKGKGGCSAVSLVWNDNDLGRLMENKWGWHKGWRFGEQEDGEEQLKVGMSCNKMNEALIISASMRSDKGGINQVG